MKDHQLRAFVHVAECGSIRAAARGMALSQGALTKALRELEKDVGAELLVRSYRGIAFTPSGQVLLKRARLALSSLEKAREEISFLQGAVDARLSVATTPLLAMHILPRILSEFGELEPRAELTLTEGLLTAVIPELIEGKLDFAVAVTNQMDLPREIDCERLQEVDALPAGAVGNPLTQARTWIELKEAKWVLNLSTGSQGQMFLSWLQRRGVAMGSITRCESPLLMAELMRRTDMLGFCPKILLDDPYYGAGLRALQIRPLPRPTTLGLLSLHGAPLGTSAQRLAALFRRHLRQPIDARRPSARARAADLDDEESAGDTGAAAAA
jgi:DNA-binding transcriptional LysR family regulator